MILEGAADFCRLLWLVCAAAPPLFHGCVASTTAVRRKVFETQEMDELGNGSKPMGTKCALLI